MSKSKIPADKLIEKKQTNFVSTLGFGALLLVIVTFTIFRTSFANQFVNWDDQTYVEEQNLVLNKQYADLWKTPISLNYHPITMTSLAMQVPNKGKALAAKPFIQLNVWLHIMNSLLVMWLIFLMTNRNGLIALFTAAIFALHPMHVESVVWVSERKDVLYTFFFLLSCLSYWKYLLTSKLQWLIITFILFILSVLSKGMAVVLPLVLLLMDFWKGREKSVISIIIEKIPFLMVSIFFGLMAINVQSGGDFGGFLTLQGEKTVALASAETFTMWQRFQFASFGFIQYIFLFFFPSKICAFYPYPNGNILTGLGAFLYPAIFLGIIGSTIWSIQKTKVVGFGIGFYFFTIVLVLQFLSVGTALMADRYTYLPYVGLAFLVIYTLLTYSRKKSTQFYYSSIGILGVFIALLAFKTSSQIKVWENPESLWTEVLKYYPSEDLALANRGNSRGKLGNIQGALADFELAISDGCDRSDVYEGLGNSYGTLSEQQPDKKAELVTKAVEMYKKAIAIDPNKGNIQYNLGIAQLQTNPEESIVAFNEALRLMPYKEKDILPLIGMSQLNARKYPDALTILTRAIDLGVSNDNIFYHRGLANVGVQNLQDAKIDFQKSLHLNPNNQGAQSQLKALQE